MRPPSPRRPRVRAALVALAVLASAAPLAAAPSLEDLRAARDALAERDAALERRVVAGHGALAADRTRLDRARADHRTALDGVRRRLRALYVSPDPSPVIEVLTGGDLGEAQARIDLLTALSRSDRDLLRRLRSSTAELRAAEAGVRRHKDTLARRQRDLGARLARAEARLAAAEDREVRLRSQSAAADVEASGVPVFGAAPADDAAPAAGDDTPARGLPAALLRARGLPGAAPRDAGTGERVDTAPLGAGPASTRAYPRVGAVGPAAGGVAPERLPTFTAVAGWYGPGFTRARMASGEPYDPAAFSAASRTLRLGTLLRVAYGGRAVTVRVNDRGPYVRGRDLDLSQAAAAALDLPGVGTVTAQILPGYSPPSRGR